MNITIIGSGYVGLVSGACLAEVGNTVLCLDMDVNKIALLNAGGVPIYEPGLDVMIDRNVKAGRLRFTSDIQESVEFGDIQFIAVGTPPDEDGSADLKYVLAAAKNIALHMKKPVIVVDKSTVPVGTADQVKAVISQVLADRNIDIEFSVASNPEFLKEGAAIEDFMRPDRIILGCNDEKSLSVLRALYAPFQRNHERIIAMDVRSAELTKYAANAMLATRISFMNELANLAECLDADIEMVRKGIGSDPRIGYDFLYPGCGYGGSCFPKDVQALIHTGNLNDCKLGILESVEQANDNQKMLIVDKIKKRFGDNLSGLTFAVWGLAFKPNTDDMRAAPSLTIIPALLAAGAKIKAYDPVAVNAAKAYMSDVNLHYCANAIETIGCNECDALIVLTEWKEFRSPDLQLLLSNLKKPIIFDGRNIYDANAVGRLGFEYFGIGRKSKIPKEHA